MSGCVQGHEPTENVSVKLWLKFQAEVKIQTIEGIHSLIKTSSKYPMVVEEVFFSISYITWCPSADKTFRCRLMVRLLSVCSTCCSKLALSWENSPIWLAVRTSHPLPMSIHDLSTTALCGVSVWPSGCGYSTHVQYKHKFGKCCYSSLQFVEDISMLCICRTAQSMCANNMWAWNVLPYI